jgi:hypothetical protein
MGCFLSLAIAGDQRLAHIDTHGVIVHIILDSTHWHLHSDCMECIILGFACDYSRSRSDSVFLAFLAFLVVSGTIDSTK